MAQRVADIKQKMQPDLASNPNTAGCILYTPKQPQRLLKLVQDLGILATTLSMAARPRKADILADVLASNLGLVRGQGLSAASNGPFRLCGRTVQLLSDIVSPAQPSPSPPPPPSPSPSPLPVPPPSPSPAMPGSPSPSPPPSKFSSLP
jgi:hypothetical protein